ncbi:MAG: NAD(P)H-hydrate dehydratase, partial [Anaerolineales bacterium]|nr:NAD(P)H-hydrate dehydratase [Anaerolineales bacterium]
MKLVTVTQMREIEKQADASGVSYAELMENAGRGLAEVVDSAAFDSDWNEAFGLVGSGNNGGDTLVALAHLAEAGWQTRAYILKRERKDKLIARLRDAGGEIIFAEDDEKSKKLIAAFESAHVLLDGLLGTGIKLPLKSEIADVLSQSMFIMSNLEAPPFVVAVDCPSGLDCDTGEAAPECLPADLTATMAAVKHGMLKLPAFEFVGDIALVDIGLPADLPAFYDLTAEVADSDLVSSLLPDRSLDSHKGTFGAALIAAGSLSYTGAALLAGSAAYRVGAGLVTLAIPEPLHAALAGQLPEATWILLPHESGFISEIAAAALLNYVHRASAFLLGPGLGFNISTRTFVEEIISNIKLPTVVDADGLRHLERIADWHKKLNKMAVLTPHVGEMSVLTGLSKEKIQSNRNEVARKYAKEWGHVVVLKGAFTVIAAPDGRMTVIPVATPALARAGTGDVLAGLIVGLRAQGLGAYDAAVAGAYIHAQAGLLAADDLGATASVL